MLKTWSPFLGSLVNIIWEGGGGAYDHLMSMRSFYIDYEHAKFMRWMATATIWIC
jgi:hypothetical protein